MVDLESGSGTLEVPYGATRYLQIAAKNYNMHKLNIETAKPSRVRMRFNNQEIEKWPRSVPSDDSVASYVEHFSAVEQSYELRATQESAWVMSVTN